MVEVGSGQYVFAYPAGDLVDRLRPAPFHVDVTVAVLLDSEVAMPVIEKHLPGLREHPLIGEAQRMSLRQVAGFAGLSEEAIEALDKGSWGWRARTTPPGGAGEGQLIELLLDQERHAVGLPNEDGPAGRFEDSLRRHVGLTD